jgi:CheY-like chemotaxis protein
MVDYSLAPQNLQVPGAAAPLGHVPDREQDRLSTILVVDDDAEFRRMIATTLYYNGFTVHEAETGLGAIQAVKELRPDLVLMDVRLPDMNGMVATEILRAFPETGDVPVICVTGMTGITLPLALERGCVELLHKPVLPAKLVQTVRRHLPQRPAM